MNNQEKINSTKTQKTHTLRRSNPKYNQNETAGFNKKTPKRSGSFQYSKFGAQRKPKSGPDKAMLDIRKRNDGIPQIEEGVIRVIPLGGVEEIGRNMTAIEIGNDIIVIDAGLQMKTENTPGVDYIIPNTSYLEERKDKIKGMIITHGHLDHIGGIPYIIDKIGNPPIYSRNLTTLMIKKRHSEFPYLPQIKLEIVENDSIVRIGNIKVKFFGVTHTIPDSMGVIIETPYGSIVTPGDFKLDHTDGVAASNEEESYKIFEKENVLLLLAESTNIENPGFSTPERLVHEGLEQIIRSVQGRLIIGTFSSQIERIIKVVEIAETLGKKVVIEGRSMKDNIEIVKFIGRLNVKKDTIITSDEMEAYPPHKIVMLATGAQGDEFGALMRMSNKTHRTVKLHKGDTILLSSSIIPGNERAVEKLKDNLARQGAKIIHYRTSEVYVHSTGHANQGEIEWLHKKIKPKFFIPIHGNHYRLKLHAELAMSLGMPESNIVVPDTGNIIEITNNGTDIGIRKERAPYAPYMVDGFSIGDVQDVVIRDRQMLAQDGMFVVIATVDQKTGKLKKSPDLISRGFIYLKDNQELLRQARILIKRTVENYAVAGREINTEIAKNALGEALAKYLFQKTAKRPLVIPVILSV